MIKKELVMLTFCLCISLVVAQLSLSEVDEVYNLGDRLYVTINGIIGADSGNLNLNLICSNTTTSLLKISARAFSSSSETSYSLPYKILSEEDLEISNIEDIVGNCFLQTALGIKIISGPQFKVSNQINIEVSSDKEEYNPGETMVLDIITKKENGEDYTGEIELSNFTEGLELVEAQKTIEVALDESLEAGSYIIGFKLSDDQGNDGEQTLEFKINQVPSRISFGVNSLDIMPGEKIAVNGEVLDQSGNIIYDTMDLEFTSPKGFRIQETLEPSAIKEIFIPFNSTKGDWKMVVTSGDLRDELTINILPSPHLEYELRDNILTVINVGNSLFSDYFNLTIGPTEKRVFAELEPTESKQFVLTAPHGNYEIGLNDGKTNFTGSTFLTGNAVSIKDLGTGEFFTSPILWLVLIAALGIGGYIFMQKSPKAKNFKGKFAGVKNIRKKIESKAPKGYKKEVSKSLNFTTKSPEVQGIDDKNYKSEDSSMKDFTLNKLKTAESSLVLKGDKVSGSVLVLKITNYDQLNAHSNSSLEKIIQSLKGHHAVIDKRNNYIFFLFVPQITKTYKNEILAARAGVELLDELNAFNKKFKQKIMFNLAASSGEMVVSKTKDKIKYTSLGNLMPVVKKMSDSASTKLIINEGIRKKLLRDLKVEKYKTLGEKQTFSVISVKDREANEQKLKDLLKRM